MIDTIYTLTGELVRIGIPVCVCLLVVLGFLLGKIGEKQP